jgi:hypothetical protein
MRCFKGPQAERNHAGQAVGGHAVVGRALVRPLVIVTVVAHLSARGSRRLCTPGSEPGTRDRTPYSWNSRDSSDSPETGEDQTLLVEHTVATAGIGERGVRVALGEARHPTTYPPTAADGSDERGDDA